MNPTTREEFKEYILRNLGKPVICINVDDEQVEDRIDEALNYYAEYHYDATDTYYFKHQVTANDMPDAVHSVTIKTAGTGYSNGEALVFTPTQGGGNGAIGTVLTNANGGITSVLLSNNGNGYAVSPTVSVTTSAGTGAEFVADLGGFIELPENIIGVVEIFDIASSVITQDMFSVQYQIALNDIWSLNSYSMVPYYTTIMHLNLIQQLLVGRQPIRFQRHKNRLYIDMLWARTHVGAWIVGKCYQRIDPADFPDIWKDRWLIAYTTALVKRQWGNHLKKFGNQTLPSGIVFNGQQIYDEAFSEIMDLQRRIITDYSIPPSIMIG